MNMDLQEFTAQINTHLPSKIQFNSEDLYKLYNLYRSCKYVILGIYNAYTKDKKNVLHLFKEEHRIYLKVLKVELEYDVPAGHVRPIDLPSDFIVIDLKEKEAWSFKDLVRSMHNVKATN